MAHLSQQQLQGVRAGQKPALAPSSRRCSRQARRWCPQRSTTKTSATLLDSLVRPLTSLGQVCKTVSWLARSAAGSRLRPQCLALPPTMCKRSIVGASIQFSRAHTHTHTHTHTRTHTRAPRTHNTHTTHTHTHTTHTYTCVHLHAHIHT